MPLKVKRKTLAARDIGRRRKRLLSYSEFGRPGAGVAARQYHASAPRRRPG